MGWSHGGCPPLVRIGQPSAPASLNLGAWVVACGVDGLDYKLHRSQRRRQRAACRSAPRPTWMHGNRSFRVPWRMRPRCFCATSLTTASASRPDSRKPPQQDVPVPSVELAKQVVGCGNTTGSSTDKWKAFYLTPAAASCVTPARINECFANLECKVVGLRIGRRREHRYSDSGVCEQRTR